VDTISRRVGAASLNGCGTHIGENGEDWVFIFSREGLYLFSSAEPPKVSQEIQPNWNNINWAYGYTGWVIVDTKTRRVLIGVPMGSNTQVSETLYLDYQTVGATAADVEANGPVKTGYTGKLWALTHSRKWSPWTIVAAGAGLIERTDGTAHLFLGNNVGNGKIYDLLDTNLDDDGAAIPNGGFYITAAIPTDEQKQEALKAMGNIVLLRYLTMSVSGIGTLDIELFGPGYVNSTILPAATAPLITLASPASQDVEMYTNFQAERIHIEVSASGALPWWSLQRLNMYIGQTPTAAIRGKN
jgi:hypothetical protein